MHKLHDLRDSVKVINSWHISLPINTIHNMHWIFKQQALSVVSSIVKEYDKIEAWSDQDLVNKIFQIIPLFYKIQKCIFQNKDWNWVPGLGKGREVTIFSKVCNQQKAGKVQGTMQKIFATIFCKLMVLMIQQGTDPVLTNNEYFE